jgi:Domain of unknown function (DUF4328)
MSDPTPPPPPPPPNLTPPPGYTAYETTNWDGSLRRVLGLSKWISALLALTAVLALVALAASGSVRDAARDYLATSDEGAFNDSLALWGVTQLLSGVLSVALIVLSIVWLFRVSANHRALGRALTWAPGWAIGGWFLPPILYVIPLLVLREAWKAANPASPLGADSWRSDSRENPWLWVWFLTYSVAPLIIAVAGASNFSVESDTDSVAKRFADHFGAQIASSAFTLAAAVAWFVAVRQLTGRHAQLTGEATAR